MPHTLRLPSSCRRQPVLHQLSIQPTLLTRPVVVRNDQELAPEAGADLLKRVPVGHEDEGVAELLLLPVVGALGAAAAAAAAAAGAARTAADGGAAGAKVDGPRDGDVQHHAHAVGGRVQVEQLGRRGEAVVGVEDVGVERLGVVAHAPLVGVGLLGRLALLLEQLVPLLRGAHDEPVDADVGGRVARPVVRAVAVDVAPRDGLAVVDLVVVPVGEVFGSWGKVSWRYPRKRVARPGVDVPSHEQRMLVSFALADIATAGICEFEVGGGEWAAAANL